MKKAFTLSELMIAMVVLGLLCAIAVPTFFNNLPSQSKMMVKKSYFTFEKVISNLVNDDNIYPNEDLGFKYFNDVNASYKTAKLPYYFAKQINTKKHISDMADFVSKYSSTNCITGASSCYRVETASHIVYTFPKEDFSTQDYILIGVDINEDKEPNCYQGSTVGSCTSQKNNFDQYMIRLYSNGKIMVRCEDYWTRASIRLDAKLSSDTENYKLITCSEDYYSVECTGTCRVNGSDIGTMTIAECQNAINAAEVCGSSENSFSNSLCGVLNVPECPCTGTCIVNGKNIGTMTFDECEYTMDHEAVCGLENSFSNPSCGTLDIQCYDCAYALGTCLIKDENVTLKNLSKDDCITKASTAYHSQRCWEWSPNNSLCPNYSDTSGCQQQPYEPGETLGSCYCPAVSGINLLPYSASGITEDECYSHEWMTPYGDYTCTWTPNR